MEPKVTQLQETLVRFLITTSNRSTSSTTTTSTEDAGSSHQESTNDSTTTTTNTKTDQVNETTTLYQLRTVQFGMAPEGTATTTTTAEESDKKVSVALLISVLLPPQKTTKDDATNPKDSKPEQQDKDTGDDKEEDEDDDDEDYQAKQTRALLLYHLRRYAMLLNCALLFVDTSRTWTDPDDAAAVMSSMAHTNKNGLPPTLSLSQTALLWRAFALGQAIWNDYPTILELPMSSPIMLLEPLSEQPPQPTEPQPEGDGDNGKEASTTEDAAATADSAAASTTTTTTTPLVFGPGSYQQDLLESVLLRNAHYPGHWDAAKEHVWTILPHTVDPDDQPTAMLRMRQMMERTTPHTTGVPSSSTSSTVGDQGWLLELQESLGTTTTTLSDSTTSATTSSTPVAATTPALNKATTPATPATSLLPAELQNLASPTPANSNAALFQTPEPKARTGSKPPKSQRATTGTKKAKATPATAKPSASTPNTAGTSKDTADFFQSLLK